MVAAGWQSSWAHEYAGFVGCEGSCTDICSPRLCCHSEKRSTGVHPAARPHCELFVASAIFNGWAVFKRGSQAFFVHGVLYSGFRFGLGSRALM
jgi:hypothetical protein